MGFLQVSVGLNGKTTDKGTQKWTPSFSVKHLWKVWKNTRVNEVLCWVALETQTYCGFRPIHPLQSTATHKSVTSSSSQSYPKDRRLLRRKYDICVRHRESLRISLCVFPFVDFCHRLSTNEKRSVCRHIRLEDFMSSLCSSARFVLSQPFCSLKFRPNTRSLVKHHSQCYE